jgi:TusA-related sulfurtransferase
MRVVLSETSENLLAAKSDLVLDVQGLVCPFTSLKTVQGLGQLPGGGVLEVITSDESSALETVPAVLRRRHLPFAVWHQGNGSWAIKVRKSVPPETGSRQPESPLSLPTTR